MDKLFGLFLVILFSLFLYLSGHYDKRKTKELKLYDSVKAIYGKRGQPIYREACIIQTIGLILGFVSILQYFSTKIGVPIFIPHTHIYRGTTLILVVSFFLDLLFDRIRRM
jgi:hypothetical protein